MQLAQHVWVIKQSKSSPGRCRRRGEVSRGPSIGTGAAQRGLQPAGLTCGRVQWDTLKMHFFLRPLCPPEDLEEPWGDQWGIIGRKSGDPHRGPRVRPVAQEAKLCVPGPSSGVFLPGLWGQNNLKASFLWKDREKSWEATAHLGRSKVTGCGTQLASCYFVG